MKKLLVICLLILSACGNEKLPALDESHLFFTEGSLDACRALESQPATRKTVQVYLTNRGYYEFSPTEAVKFRFDDGRETIQPDGTYAITDSNSVRYCQATVTSGIVSAVTY